MKKSLFSIISLSIAFLLASCVAPSGNSEKPSGTAENTGVFDFSTEEIQDKRIDDYPFFAESIENTLDTISIRYVDGGVHIDFTGSNEFGDGYAFIPNTNLISGTAEYFEKDDSDKSSSEIYVYDGSYYIVISETEENPAMNGVSYERYYSKEMQETYSYLKLSSPQLWEAEGATIIDTVSDDEAYIEGALTEMNTTYKDGNLSIEITGIGETVVIDNVSADLNGHFLFEGSSEEYEIYVVPDSFILLVILTSNDKEIELIFENKGIYFDSTNESVAPQVSDLEIVYNNVEYTTPSFEWSISHSVDEFRHIFQFKLQDGNWFKTPSIIDPEYNGKANISVAQLFQIIGEDGIITEARVGVFPTKTPDGMYQQPEDFQALMDSFDFTKGENWIDCNINFETENDSSKVTVNRVSGNEEMSDDFYRVYYEVKDLMPNQLYSFKRQLRDSISSGFGFSDVTDEYGVFEFRDTDYDGKGSREDFGFTFSTQSSGDIENNDEFIYSLFGYIIEIGEEQNGIIPYSVTKETYTNFYLNTDNVDVDGLEQVVTEPTKIIQNILTSRENYRDTIEIRYEDDGVYLDFTGSNIFGDGYALIPNSSILRNAVVPFYSDDESEESTRNLVIDMHTIDYDKANFFFEDDFKDYVEYQIDEDWIEAMDKEFVGEEGVSQNWTATKATLITSENEDGESIDFSNISATSVSQNGEIYFNIDGIDEYFSHTEAIFTGYYNYSYLYEEGALGTNYKSTPFKAYFENDILYVQVGYSHAPLIIEFEKVS